MNKTNVFKKIKILCVNKSFRKFLFLSLFKIRKNKIIFIDDKYENLLFWYKKSDKKYFDYIKINSEKNYDQLYELTKYRKIIVSKEWNFLKYLSYNRKIFCIWHAFGAFKKIGKYNSTIYFDDVSKSKYKSYFDYLFVSSKEIIPLYADAFNMKKENVISFGLWNFFLNDIDKREEKITEIYKKYGFLKNKIIYAFFPTFIDKIGIKWNLNFNKLANLLNENEIVLFFRHPYVELKNSNFLEIKNKIYDFTNEKNAKYLYFNSIVTDCSSSIFEILLINENTNILFVKNELIEQNRGLWVSFKNLPGEKIEMNENENIENKLISMLRSKIKNQYLLKSFISYHIGQSSKESVQQILEYILLR